MNKMTHERINEILHTPYIVGYQRDELLDFFTQQETLLKKIREIIEQGCNTHHSNAIRILLEGETNE